MTFSRYVCSGTVTFLILPSIESHVTLCKSEITEDEAIPVKKNAEPKILP